MRHSSPAAKAHPFPEVSDRTLAALTEGETGGKSNVCPADHTVLREGKSGGDYPSFTGKDQEREYGVNCR